MKISMISEHANPLATPGTVDSGGQNVHVEALSRGLAALGHEVTVFTRRDNPDIDTRVKLTNGVHVVHVDAGPPERIPKDELLPYMWDFGKALGATWTTDTPDVIHSHFWMSGVAALEGVRSLSPHLWRPPVMHTYHALGSVKRRHQQDADTSPAERSWLEPFVGRHAHTVIATCDSEVQELISMGIPQEHIQVAPCGVNTDAFDPFGRAEERGQRFRIVTVGRLVPRKGIDTVIESLAVLKDHDLDAVELEVVGAGSETDSEDSERGRLQQLAARLGVRDRVHFRGQVDRQSMPAIIRSADAVVCTPWYEPFGIVPLESMACCVPVVVSAVGGLADSVVDGVTGLHVPPRDPRALAGALAKLLPDTDLKRRLGFAGRMRVEALYTWEQVAQRTASLYEQALAQRTRGYGQLSEVSS